MGDGESEEGTEDRILVPGGLGRGRLDAVGEQAVARTPNTAAPTRAFTALTGAIAAV
jgi:hypothetical protein